MKNKLWHGGRGLTEASTDIWLTPRWIRDALGPFDLDVSAADPRPWDMATHSYTVEDNGLLQPWFGRVWCNPPYQPKLIARFMGRMAEHGWGTALVFARTDTRWFQENVFESAGGLLFLEGRLRFARPDGTEPKRPAGAASVLIAYGDDDTDRLAAANIDGAFIPLPGRRQFILVCRPTTENCTWREVIETVVREHGGTISLAAAYDSVRHHPKARDRQHWMPKVRQTLRELCKRVGPAQYALELT